MANGRDLGGWAVDGGGRTRYGQVFRSDLPLMLGDAEREVLRHDAGIGVVLDVRTADEVRHVRGSLSGAGFDVVHLPLASARETAISVDQRNAASVYRGFVTNRPEVLVRALSCVVREERGVLIHCAAGKDRTGVVVALLLDLLGVELEAIAQEYLLTGPCIAEIYRGLRRSSYYAEVLDRRGQTHPARFTADGIIDVVRHVRAEHGGVRALLGTHGVASADIDRFVARMVE